MYDGGDTNGTKMTGVKMKQEVAILTVKKLIAVMKRSLKFGATNMTAVEMKTGGSYEDDDIIGKTESSDEKIIEVWSSSGNERGSSFDDDSIIGEIKSSQ